MTSILQDRKGKWCTNSCAGSIENFNLWFWHASFGYAGSLNDLNILNLSPFLELLVDGTFTELEKNCRKAPYKINGNVFHRFFVLVDGIYPPYSRFVIGICSDRQGKEIYSMAGGGKERY